MANARTQLPFDPFADELIPAFLVAGEGDECGTRSHGGYSGVLYQQVDLLEPQAGSRAQLPAGGAIRFDLTLDAD